MGARCVCKVCVQGVCTRVGCKVRVQGVQLATLAPALSLHSIHSLCNTLAPALSLKCGYRFCEKARACDSSCMSTISAVCVPLIRSDQYRSPICLTPTCMYAAVGRPC
jgi:hypothetical protein